MHVDLLFPSKYLKAADLQGRKVPVTIDKVEAKHSLQMAGGRKESKPVVHFSNAKKMWVLNKTNAKRIAAVYGNEIDDWAGCTVVLYSEAGDYPGGVKEAVRVDEAATRKKANGAAKKAPEPECDPETGEVAI